MDNLQQPMNIAEYNSLITNIIESAVHELIQKRRYQNETDINGTEYSLLLNMCRLCAREEESASLQNLSEYQLTQISELAVPGFDPSSVVSSGCSKVCTGCSEFLYRLRDFRGKCEEAQKKISSLLAERNVISDFLNLDFVKHEAFQDKTNEPVSSPSSSPITKNTTPSPKVDNSPFENTKKLEETNNPEIENHDPEFAFSELSESSESDPSEFEEPTIHVKPKPKKKRITKASDSRRRVVNGKLQWVCLDCEQIFTSCIKLKQHRRSCDMVGNKKSKRQGPFTCEICGQSLPTLIGLRVHVHKHSRRGAEEDKKDNKDGLLEPKKQAVCHVCGKAFANGSLLRSHLVFHGQEKKIECQICNKKFHKLFRLKDHLDCHTEERQYSCQVCGKAFFTKAILYKHTRTHDENFRKHQCPMCPSRFAHPYRLRSHMMIHTAEYPHACKLCSSKFRFTWDLKKHYAKAHPFLSELDQEPELIPLEHELANLDPINNSQSELVPHQLLAPQELLAPSLVLSTGEPTSTNVALVAVGLMEDEQHQHDDLSVMLADIPPHQTEHEPELTPSVAAVQPVIAEHPFDTEQLLEEASRDFTSDCFPEPVHHHLVGAAGHSVVPEDDFYTFMEC
ncbi:zinc finger protein weckle-like [Uranotaenia lowii]|uniref:zinc finger protein weckle-like n=1 Tax=Uranotaenia lowii TaxID=190385 RepID=UPI00247ACAFF|nr:zinc finger protein weckle-like [Uranotaenia lowii]